MAEQIPEDYAANFEQFRDIFSSLLIEKLSAPSHRPTARAKRRSKKSSTSSNNSGPTGDDNGNNDDDHTLQADDLADFTTYLATSTFISFPVDLQSLSHRSPSETLELYSAPLSPDTTSDILTPLDPAIFDSLSTYLPPSSNSDADSFFASLLETYVFQVTSPPPPPSSTRGKITACEICGRDWINLTYHHLIPRMVHDKAVKRGWHRKEDLQNVAWLCGACHRFVHKFKGHEELAREYFTVERLLEEEEVREFAKWVGRLRWKGR
ncbi:hypothetical protein QBC42DRAFT_324789 [Cladorrhinum samala]|uniref:HNH domain-containing protein n=1 Tax=Cladorrhinum samala TaxID=585594 RepID=A0AAV9HV24_9PEZI|nr:hypothetical protein QBC42DRAFT_324789 [Cladorrhinum samala]